MSTPPPPDQIVPDDYGKRIAAARSYAGLSRDALADSIGLTPTALQRIEAGIEDLDTDARWAALHAVSQATRVPMQAFIVDFDTLPVPGSPTERFRELRDLIESALSRMDEVADEADRQMTRGKEQLDRFIESMEGDRELLHRIAKQLGIHPDQPS